MKKQNKLEQLKKIVTDMKSVVVAYSGGVDSTFLAKVAYDTLGKENMLAITATSSTYPSHEFKEAKKIAKSFGFPWKSISSEELDITDFSMNSPDRCYYCKSELFKKLRIQADKNKYKEVLDGSNFDDLKDYRPGMRAIKEIKVKSPLKMVKMTKDDIRKYSKKLGLPTWNKPAYACLASRFPYGQTIDKKKLEKVDKAEALLRKLNLKQLRVRCDNNTARLEIEPSDFPKIIKKRIELITKFKKLGFHYLTLDLEGYRTGSMNEVLNLKKKGKK